MERAFSGHHSRPSCHHLTCMACLLHSGNQTVQTSNHIVAWRELLNSDLCNSVYSIIYMDLDYQYL